METPKVTPVMQASMRTTQAKALKRGRKVKKGSGNRGGKAPRKSKGKAIKEQPAKGNKTHVQPGKKRTKNTPKEPKTTKGSKEKKEDPKVPPGRRSKQSSEHQQDRVPNGKTWAYQVLPGQKLGCCACRFIFNGCSTCRKPGFKGKSPQTMRSEQLQAQEWENYEWDDEKGDWVWVEDSSNKRRKSKSSKKKWTMATALWRIWVSRHLILNFAFPSFPIHRSYIIYIVHACIYRKYIYNLLHAVYIIWYISHQAFGRLCSSSSLTSRLNLGSPSFPFYHLVLFDHPRLAHPSIGADVTSFGPELAGVLMDGRCCHHGTLFVFVRPG